MAVPVLKQFICGFSLQTGTIVIAILHLYSLDPEVAFGSAFIQTICAILLLFGATLEIAGLLLPWIILETLDLVVMTAISIIGCFFLTEFAKSACIGLIGIVFVIISSLLGTYCLMVVYSYYQTLLENGRPNAVQENTVV